MRWLGLSFASFSKKIEQFARQYRYSTRLSPDFLPFSSTVDHPPDPHTYAPLRTVKITGGCRCTCPSIHFHCACSTHNEKHGHTQTHTTTTTTHTQLTETDTEKDKRQIETQHFSSLGTRTFYDVYCSKVSDLHKWLNDPFLTSVDMTNRTAGNCKS